MSQIPMFQIDFSEYRPGQLVAHKMIVDRVKAGEPYTAIVLPTRYGKSDVIRVTAYDLHCQGIITYAVALSPNILLRDQLISEKKWKKTFRRYGIIGLVTRTRTVSKPHEIVHMHRDGELFYSITMQLANQNENTLCAWIDSVITRENARVLFYIDETHTGSEDNKWGGSLVKFVEAGAQAVLLTATPIRSDGRRIPGFEWETIERAPVKRYVVREHEEPEWVNIDVYEGEKILLRLKAHYELTFQEAWAESLSPLCKLSRIPFDVDLKRIRLDRDLAACNLSELPPSSVRKYLGRIIRDHQVIRRGCQELVSALRIMRKNDQECAAIVFCGNDQDSDQEINRHAKIIRNEIERIDADLTIAIATSADGKEGVEKIRRFAGDEDTKGEGDILIVKQMAGLGIDAPRLKVQLDLSPVRTPAAYIQRIMRIATPKGHIRHAIYIAPDDALSRALFESLVTDNNGEISRTELEKLIETLVKKRKEQPEPEAYMVDGTHAAPFEDNVLNRADGSQLTKVQAILSRLPELSSWYTHAELALRLDGLEVHSDQADTIENTDYQRQDLKDSCNESANELARIRMRMADLSYSQKVYRDYIKQAWKDARRMAGVANREWDSYSLAELKEQKLALELLITQERQRMQ